MLKKSIGVARFVVLVLFLLGTTDLRADVVLPSSFESTEGTLFEETALGFSANRIQLAYGVSELQDLNVGDRITGLTFRIDSDSGGLATQTINEYEIRLSESQNLPGSLSTIFAENRGADEVVVRSGNLTINSTDWTTGGSPNAFGAIIPFSTSYIYQGGPLLLEYAHDGFPLGGTMIDAAFDPSLDTHTLVGTDFSSTTADFQDVVNAAIVVQFQVSAVPELSSVAMLSLVGLSFLGYRRRRLQS